MALLRAQRLLLPMLTGQWCMQLAQKVMCIVFQPAGDDAMQALAAQIAAAMDKALSQHADNPQG